jgi:hypothetical protein
MISKARGAFNGENASGIPGVAVPVFLYCLVLLIRIPYPVSRAFSAYSLPFFLLVLLVYYFAFRLPGAYSRLAAACVTVVLLGLSLSFLWNSGYSDDKVIGGLLPFRDAFDYYNGANWILRGHAIRIINEGASWRPLYPGFLAALLFMTGRNLQWALAVQVGLAGLCFSFAANEVRRRLGPAGAALFATLLYFHIQPLIGTAYTETLGLALGCIGFCLLLQSVETRRSLQLILGLVMVMLAVSARAGAFFVFPMLVAWAGWAWRGHGRFSLRYAGLAFETLSLSFLIVNTLFTRLMVEPGGYSFGNFAFTIYGQVVGGAGYHKAFEDLGVRNPAVILRAAERFFFAHPLGFVAGAAKAYRDFFSPQWGVFSFGPGLQDRVAAVVGTLLLLAGLYRSWKQRSAASSSLLVACFMGILFSIPFLPPIDGGVRIYASTMPYLFVLPAVALAGLRPGERGDPASPPLGAASAFVCIVLALLTLVAPVALRSFARPPTPTALSCPVGQVPYAAEVPAGSYVDLVPVGSLACDSVPEICVSQLQEYAASSDPSDAQMFAQLAGFAQSSAARIFAANDLVNGKPHFFAASADALKVPGAALVTGCAAETTIRGRPSIYAIQTITFVGAAP